MTDLWSRADLTALPGARLLGEPGPVGGISIDTRTLAPGDVFFAIRGVASDGHDHVRSALSKGAAAAVVAEGREAAFSEAGALVVVPDVLAALEVLGRAARARTRGRIVAVTGSVGKTGTKDALRLVLGRFGATHAATASFNNHWGVPITLARMPEASRFGVFEIGMNHPGEILPLTAMVRPEIAIVTSVEPVHIGHFRAIQGIADAKGEIFAGMEPGGVAVLPRDNAHFARLAAHAQASRAGRIVSFGEGEGADVRALRIAAGADASMVEADVMGHRVAYRIGMAGRHVALNSLAVLATVAALGLDIDAAASAYAAIEPAEGRGERARIALPGGGEFLLVDESFNANPASMRAALATLALTEVPEGGRRIAVLAEMGELGEAGPAAHTGLAEPVVASKADLVFAAGPLMLNLWPHLPASIRAAHADHASGLHDAVADAIRPGDVVMVKGSKYTLVSKLAASLRARFASADKQAGTGRAAQ
ncbi:UDP-N-acetylmuramoylalanyl-D-glutamyl-2,6-diaminopimelate--D-alanyl-D-alanine ligase [Enterovirga rhinocerotis]|uniref:UDP-N-acetylmuramoyl-tripeptide--D-alanyl-D-alanine ligase n=1 Tax=Enterovirga rhinocerotis TaxID=1339210 RepID=A0A4R7BSB3_9HYPH|nr:UDP-N-acetylmuramoylalanyl-D-glutamyl-2,6-diaminopimelate--D-alanyl-D-alanine ligase [Enterovirga rhinocerotis]TDR88153.1 UDP-N-acetylmuramoyl-tripeptide--D-alanyl-D-alanine ligase [Enterovirga rhinocerotis]